MTADAKPLTDEEIAKLNDPLFLDIHSSLLSFRTRIVATIKADRATIDALRAENARLRGLLREMKNLAYFSTGNGYETIEDTLQNLDADPADYSRELVDLQARVLAELEGK